MLFMSFNRPPSTSAQTSPGGSFTEFESGQVAPIAMSPNGARLFAVDTPNNTLEIFSITPAGLALESRVPVGLEPVTVTPRDDSAGLVAHLLSDSVRVVS